MRECTFISKLSLFAITLLLVLNETAGAQQPPAPPGPPNAGAGAKKDEQGLFDQSSPYLEYGDFNINEDDDADTIYFQYGRFFGLSLGLGYQAATGNRGLLYTPAFPRFDIKVHYWFDFQLAMNMGIFFASHTYDFSGLNTAKLIGYGVDIKYYFDVKNASAVLSFSNPFMIAGVGSMSKTVTSGNSITPDLDSSFSVNFGAGLEFPISHKKTYFILESRYHTQNFIDTDETQYTSRGITDLSGGFFTIMGHVLFCW